MNQAQKSCVVYLNPQHQKERHLQEEEEEKLRAQISALPSLAPMDSVLREQMSGAARIAIENLTAMMVKNYCRTYAVTIPPKTAERLLRIRACMFYVRHCAELMMRLKKEAFEGKR